MKEPTGLSLHNGKRPDGLTLVPWQTGKALVWDVTVPSTLAGSYLVASSQTSGAAAELASAKKINKYADISAAYIVQPIAVVTRASQRLCHYLSNHVGASHI